MTLNGAIKQLHDLRTADDMPVYYKSAIAAVINVLLMDAQEVRHGCWIDDGLSADNHSFHVWRCSKCDKSLMMKDSLYELGAPWLKYCPNCGAKMVNKNG